MSGKEFGVDVHKEKGDSKNDAVSVCIIIVPSVERVSALRG